MSVHHRNTRAWRRHDAARIRTVRSRYQQVARRTFDSETADQDRAYLLGVLLHTARACSCAMCGNPRRYDKDRLTLAEKRSQQTSQDGWLEYLHEGQ